MREAQALTDAVQKLMLPVSDYLTQAKQITFEPDLEVLTQSMFSHQLHMTDLNKRFNPKIVFRFGIPRPSGLTVSCTNGALMSIIREQQLNSVVVNNTTQEIRTNLLAKFIENEMRTPQPHAWDEPEFQEFLQTFINENPSHNPTSRNA